MPTSEPEIREMLRRRANAFAMDAQPPAPIERRVRRRITGKLALAAGGLASIALVATLLIGTIGAPGTAPRRGVDTGSSSRGSSVKLVSYLFPDATTSDGQADSGLPAELSDHLDCMRAQGFDLPDPVRTSDGWTISADPSVVDIGSPEWREAAFVTCHLPLPASGNFILGLSKERVDRFVACVSDQGFDLPEPTLNGDGEFVFDLTGTAIDMSSREWNHAA